MLDGNLNSTIPEDSELYTKYRKLMSTTLMKYKGRPFIIMVDNEILSVGEDNNVSGRVKKRKMIRASYRDDNKPGQYHIGFYQAVNSNPEFVDDQRLDDYILNLINSCQLIGLDLKDAVNPVDFELNVDSSFNVIYIKTAAYKLISAISTTKYTQIKLRNSNRQFDAGEILQIKERFKLYLIDKYINVCDNLVLHRLKSVNALKFYKLHDSFVPILISGSFIVNPFLDIPEIRDRFKQTDLYKMSEKTIKHYDKVAIRYLTHLEICRCLHLTRFSKMPWDLATNIIAGNYDTAYPNDTTPIYVLRNMEDVAQGYEIIITSVEYARLSDSAKDLYMERTTLYVLALQFGREVGDTKGELYSILKDNYL